jgi:hypothetical protein
VVVVAAGAVALVVTGAVVPRGRRVGVAVGAAVVGASR